LIHLESGGVRGGSQAAAPNIFTIEFPLILPPLKVVHSPANHDLKLKVWKRREKRDGHVQTARGTATSPRSCSTTRDTVHASGVSFQSIRPFLSCKLEIHPYATTTASEEGTASKNDFCPKTNQLVANKIRHA